MPQADNDLYDVIGVPREASQEQIQKACIDLAKRYEAERQKGDVEAARRFAAVEAAFEVLGSPERRLAYDRALIAPATAGRTGFPLPVVLGLSAVAIAAILGGGYVAISSSTSVPKSASAKVHSEKLDNAFHALKKLQAHTETGISYNEYSKTLGDTWFLVKEYLESPEAKLEPSKAAAIGDAMASYNIAAVIWGVQISEPDTERTRMADEREPHWAMRLKERVPDLDRFLYVNYGTKRYRLSEAVQAQWQQASGALRRIEEKP